MDNKKMREDMIRMHKNKIGIETDKAEEDFILLSQSLPHYGGHFYTATWVILPSSSYTLYFMQNSDRRELCLLILKLQLN